MTFITFEGGEGTGKSTQIKLLEARLHHRLVDVVLTREPGGTKQGEALRPLLTSGDASWSPESEALLIYAARRENIVQNILPALKAGKLVLCDRFCDSTDVYQGHAGGVAPDFLRTLRDTVVGSVMPTLTLVFDLDPAIGLKRAKERGTGEDRYEKRGLAYHQKLREGFLALCKAEPNRCKKIDASESVDDVSQAIWAHVEPLLNG